jgi:hypothetical protein
MTAIDSRRITKNNPLHTGKWTTSPPSEANNFSVNKNKNKKE